MSVRVHIAGDPFKPWFKHAELGELQDAFKPAGDLLMTRAHGLFTVGGELGVVLPRCYRDAQGHDRLVAAGHLCRVLTRYLRDKRGQHSVENQALELGMTKSGSVENLLDGLDARLGLWEDWRLHGALPVAERQTSPRVRGRIHWPRTVAHAQQLVSQREVLYPEPIRTRHGIAPRHPLTLLHEATCDAAGRWLGWIAGADRRREVRAATALATLNQVERTLFQDRQRAVCRLLRRYHSTRGGESTRGTTAARGILATDFALIWEQMLRVALGPVENVSLPSGTYRHAGNSEPGMGLRTDAVIATRWRDQDIRIVLDAKDYDTKGLPKTDSLTKQILYRLLMSDRFIPTGWPMARIGNAFVLPASEPKGVAVRAVHDLEGEKSLAAPLGRVIAVDVDFTRVATAYVTRRPDTRLRAQVVEAIMAVF